MVNYGDNMADKNQRYEIAKDYRRTSDLPISRDTRANLEKALESWTFSGDVTQMQAVANLLAKTNPIADIERGMEMLMRSNQELTQRVDDLMNDKEDSS